MSRQHAPGTDDCASWYILRADENGEDQNLRDEKILKTAKIWIKQWAIQHKRFFEVTYTEAN